MLRSGGDETGAISVRHLLMHAGGLTDHAESPAYLAAILADPSHVGTGPHRPRAAIHRIL